MVCASLLGRDPQSWRGKRGAPLAVTKTCPPSGKWSPRQAGGELSLRQGARLWSEPRGQAGAFGTTESRRAAL